MEYTPRNDCKVNLEIKKLVPGILIKTHLKRMSNDLVLILLQLVESVRNKRNKILLISKEKSFLGCGVEAYMLEAC